MRALFSRIAKSEGGAAIVELAIVAPILASMVVGVTDLSMAFSRKLVLEQAVQRGVEKIMQTTGEDTVDDTIKNEVSAAAGVPVGQVTVNFTLTCNGVSQNYSTQCTPDNIKEVRYIEISVWDTFTPVIPIKFAGMQSDGTYRLTATNGVRTQ